MIQELKEKSTRVQQAGYPFTDKRRKLDYGCGEGGFEEIDYLNAKHFSWLKVYGGPNSHGIDINPLRIYQAKTQIQNGTIFHSMDSRALDFPDNYFDIVHEFGVFHHMPGYEEGIKEVHRVLKPKGVFLLTESVDNDIAFRLCRRIFSKWHDDKVANNFTSDLLDVYLNLNFNIVFREYHWRFLPSDFLRQYNLEPRISLALNEGVSQAFNMFGLGKLTCCHYVVKAVKN